MYKYRFTVFTPTFNRGYIIENIFESLKRQTFKNFEWIIVDDGSTDDTETKIQSMIQENAGFPIVYVKTENGGKHRAWNKGVDLASGELFFGCDSDDYLTDDALEISDFIEKTIPIDKKKDFAGICGLKANSNSELIGTSFSHNSYMDFTYLQQIKQYYGDKSEIFYTDIWMRYKYTEFPGEKFITEATSLNRMAADGLKIRYFNQVVKICDYLDDGLTKNSLNAFINSPNGWGLYIYQQIQYGRIKGMKKWETITTYYDSCNSRLGLKKIAENLHKNPFSIRLISYLTRIKWKYFK